MRGASRSLIDQYERALPQGGWPNWVLGNHDNPRIASRVGREQARVAAMLLLTLRGTPTLYYGDEIGMVDVPIPPSACGMRSRRICQAADSGATPPAHRCNGTRVKHAGFSDVEPWLPVAPDSASGECRSRGGEPHVDAGALSRAAGIAARSSRARSGRLSTCRSAAATLLAYLRRTEEEAFLVALNLGSMPSRLSLETLGLGRPDRCYRRGSIGRRAAARQR